VMDIDHRVGAIIVAAGSSTRMGGIDKMLLTIGGRSLITHALGAFARCDAVERIVVVASEANWIEIENLVRPETRKACEVVLGGERRRDSVRAGLEMLLDCDYIVVHDGARPLVTSDLIEAVLEGAKETGAALCAIPVMDTVKRADPQMLVRSTVSRDRLWLAQTPQAFRRDLLVRAHELVEGEMTDDAAMVEHISEPVRIVPGSTRNIKVTTPPDAALAEALLRTEMPAE
jgi:2-C-methyl-D-erythritol 4-phosphate cytidylyltransferase